MFVRVFKKDGSYKDGELIYKDLGVEEVEGPDGSVQKVEKYEMTLIEGLPQGIVPTHAMRMEWEDANMGGGS